MVRRKSELRTVIAAPLLVLGAVAGGAVLLPELVSGSANHSGNQEAAAGDPEDAIPPDRLLQVLDTEARLVFAAAGPEIGRHHSKVEDALGQPLPSGSYGDASRAAVEYTSESRVLSLSLSYAPSESEGVSSESCADGVKKGLYLTCEISNTDDTVVVVKTKTLRLEFSADGTVVRSIVVTDGGASSDPEAFSGVEPSLWFKRSVQVINLKTGQITSASETVRAESRSTAEQTMIMEVGKLRSLAENPALILQSPEK